MGFGCMGPTAPWFIAKQSIGAAATLARCRVQLAFCDLWLAASEERHWFLLSLHFRSRGGSSRAQMEGFASTNRLKHAARPAIDRNEREAMKRLLAICMILGGVSVSFAQGLQGNVRISGNVLVKLTGHSVTLTWDSSQNATSYNVYRGTVSGGPYTKLASGVANTTYTDVHVTHNQTLYYVTTAVSGSNESGYSNEVAAAIP